MVTLYCDPIDCGVCMQTWRMLSEMVLRRGAIRRMFTHVMSGAEHREPSSREWAIGERILNVLDRPCKIVTKSQDKGHWLLSNAVESICRMFVAVTSRAMELQQEATIHEASNPPTHFPDMDKLELTMLQTLTGQLQKFVSPLREYDRRRAHVALALLCDHRHRRGEVFYWMSTPTITSERLEKHQQLMDQYTNRHMIPAMVKLQLNKVQRTPVSTQQKTSTTNRNSGGSELFSVPDNLLAIDATTAVSDEQAMEDRLTLSARLEIERFRQKEAVSEGDKDTHPLEWWKYNSRNYPMLAQLARLCLACPGSQIENERVFSLCGLTVSNLRNKMTTDNLEEVIYLTKNTPAEETVTRLLSKASGQSAAHMYLYHKEGDLLTNMPRPEQSAVDDELVEVEDEANDTSSIPLLAATNLDDVDDESSDTETSDMSVQSGGSFDEELGI